MKPDLAHPKLGPPRRTKKPVGLDALSKQIITLQNKLDLVERQNRMILHRLTLPPEAAWRNQPQLLPDVAPLGIVFDHSVMCRQDSFLEPYFSFWVRELKEGLRYHRKLWEFVFICQVLQERDMLREGREGLGFGVGIERLSAYFASRGCRILGTDMDTEGAIAAGWSDTAQHARGKQALSQPAICDPEVFERLVDFRTVDMNAVPADLIDFDFCWSACALEHLGSIDLGLAFIERSLETLKPGGIAVHTTEFNVSSNDETLADGGTVLFRRRDMEALTRRLEAKGHAVVPFDFDPGYDPVDRYIDVAPYMEAPHLKLESAGYVTTSIGIIVRRGNAT